MPLDYQVQRCSDIITFNNTVINNSNLFILCKFYSFELGFFFYLYTSPTKPSKNNKYQRDRATILCCPFNKSMICRTDWEESLIQERKAGWEGLLAGLQVCLFQNSLVRYFKVLKDQGDANKKNRSHYLFSFFSVTSRRVFHSSKWQISPDGSSAAARDAWGAQAEPDVLQQCEQHRLSFSSASTKIHPVSMGICPHPVWS